MNFSIYHFEKSKVSKFSDLYSHDKIKSYTKVTPKKGTLQQLEVELFLETEKENDPPWVKFVDPYFALPSIKNVSNSILILIAIRGRGAKKLYFAITGGQGHHCLNKGALVQDFGLKVALNSIDPYKISMFDAKNLESNQRLSRTIFAKGNSLSEFRFDENEELVNLISGRPVDKTLATKITGSMSLRIAADLNFKDVEKKCLELHKLYTSKDYQKTFPFIDNFKPISDATLLTKLESELVDLVNKREVDGVSLTLPTIDDYSQAESYEYRWGSNLITSREFDIINAYKVIDDAKISITSPLELRSLQITTCNDNGMAVGHYNLYETIAVEIKENKGAYFLNNGKWYEVERKFLDKMEKEFARIEVIAEKNYLPNIKSGETEGAYNARLDNKKMCIYDKALFHAPSTTAKVEICDAYWHDKKHLICVKKFKGSAALSHLFAQGSVSLQLLAEYDDYRKVFCKRTNDHFGVKSYDPKTLKVSDFKMVYAVAPSRKASLGDVIPFFSKINILTHARAIRSRGAQLALYKIEEK